MQIFVEKTVAPTYMYTLLGNKKKLILKKNKELFDGL